MSIPARQKFVSQLGSQLPLSTLDNYESELRKITREYNLSDVEYEMVRSSLVDRRHETATRIIGANNRLLQDARNLDFDSMTDVQRVCCPEWRLKREI